jgi:hypothetical protein
MKRHLALLIVMVGLIITPGPSFSETTMVGTSVDPLPSLANGGMTYSIGSEVGGFLLATPLFIPEKGDWLWTDFKAAVLMETNSAGDGTSMLFSLYDDNNGVPGNYIGVVGIAGVPSSGIPYEMTSFLYQTAPNELQLVGDRQYWLVASVYVSNGTACVWWLTNLPLSGTIATSYRSSPWSIQTSRLPAFVATFQSQSPAPELISIDIKPGRDPASINPKSQEVIPVAILTTKTFDATTVDATTVHFGKTGIEATAVRSALKDVVGDGILDLILYFKTQNTGITCGDISASLTGKTFSGQAIEGSDAIVTVGCRK